MAKKYSTTDYILLMNSKILQVRTKHQQQQDPHGIRNITNEKRDLGQPWSQNKQKSNYLEVLPPTPSLKLTVSIQCKTANETRKGLHRLQLI